MFWWAVLQALLYSAAILFVLFYDTRADLATPKQQQSWWTTFRFRTEEMALFTFIYKWVMLAGQTTIHYLYYFYSRHICMWYYSDKGSNGRDQTPAARRRRKFRATMLSHLRLIKPRSRKSTRALAAAVALMHLSRTHAQAHSPRAQALRDILSPPPPPTLSQEYVSAFSIMINQAETDLPDLTVCPAPFDSDAGIIGVDNRASATITNKEEDVVPGTLELTNKKVKVFGGSFNGLVYKCTINWSFQDHSGMTHKFLLPNSYYIPQGEMRLLSPQHWARELIKQGDGNAPGVAPRVITDHAQVRLEWNNRTSHLTVPLDKHSNVANIYQSPGYHKYKLFLQQAKMEDETHDKAPVTLLEVMGTNIVSDDEESQGSTQPDEQDCNTGWSVEDSEGEPREITFDLTPDDQANSETHVVFDEQEDPADNLAAELLRVHHQFNHIGFAKLKLMAKSGILPKRLANAPAPVCTACMYGKATRRPWRDKPKSTQAARLRKITHAGQCVSVDMLKSPTPGLVAQMAGWITNKRYNYATVFVDHHSGLGYLHLQKTQSVRETLQGKALFEQRCAAAGIKVEHYHADNGVFASNEWKYACEHLHQGYSYSGVNAHFQSGVAERRIRELQELAWTMLLHASSCWVGVVNSHLWPYAMRLACEAYNESPTTTLQRSPVEIFTKATVMPEPKHWRPFGCPVYVLDNALQHAGGIKHKWEERSRIGVYLGRSPFHARSVALVLNLRTGRVSPQFHVQFDPGFQTVRKFFGGQSTPSLWQSICGFTRANPEAVKQREPPEQQQVQFTLEPNQSQLNAAPDLPPEPPQTEEQSQAQAEPQLRRSTRVSRPVIGNRLVDALTVQVVEATVPEDQTESPEEDTPAQGELFSYSTLFPLHDEEDVDPIQAYAASADPDTLYHHEAMREPDREKFMTAMEKEFQDQWDNGNFVLKRRTDIPEGARVLPAVWAMKRKRKVLTGEVYKHKARMNLDGSKQLEGIDYNQTYSPTASWPAVRLQLALTLVNNGHTKQIDFVQAFPQAPMLRTQYMKLPKGIQIEGVDDPSEWVLELKKNLYGGKDAGRNWYLFLKGKLKDIGFVRSNFDECVFFKGTCMYVLYTDDSILAGPNKQELDQIIADIKGTGLEITDEGDIADFLGVNIQREGGSFHLTQPKLIDSILEDLSLQEGSHTKDIPMASSKLLSRHKDSPDFDHHFNYRRIVGKLNFLEQSTRGDISYATHMLARFSTCPKVQHGAAVKWLGRYLLGTRDKGIILTPDPTKGLELYVDADFAGAWDPKLAGEDIDTARSRHGYIIAYAGVPLLWKSSMQGEITLSSTESELVGLSAGLRTTIPLQNILNEMKDKGFDILPEGPVIHCKAFEDNNGALAIAKVPKMRPRIKHINLKYFHFVEYTSRDDAPFSFEKIDTEEQPADMLTKPLAIGPLSRHRKWLLGW